MDLDNSERQRVRFFNKCALYQIVIAVVGAAASAVCFNTGYFSFFFLLPLSLAVFFGEPKTAWAAGILAAALNVLFLVWAYLYLGADPFLLKWNALWYTAMVLVFAWINIPLGKLWILREIPFRMVAGAAFCTLLFVPLFFWALQNDEIKFLFTSQIKALGSLSASPETYGMTIEETISSLLSLILRGGIPLSCMVFWWINRQFGLMLSRLFRRDRTFQAGNFLGFKAPFFLVWILSFSLGIILLGKINKIEIIEICGWNILVLSATLFFIQGIAIFMHLLMRFPPFLRIIASAGIVILFFRPEFSKILLGLFVVLGITENWVPFRAPKE
jgi:hypothetical protein